MKMKEICLQMSSNHPLKETWTWRWSIFAACMFLRWIEVLIEISQPVTSSLHFKRKIETAHSSWCSRVRWIHFFSFINQTTVEIKYFHFTMHYAPVCMYQILEWRFLLPVPVHLEIRWFIYCTSVSVNTKVISPNILRFLLLSPV